jgi:hypothetical protein
MALYKRKHSTMVVMTEPKLSIPASDKPETIEAFETEKVTIQVGDEQLVVILTKDGGLEARYVPKKSQAPKKVFLESSPSGAVLRVLP